MKKVIFIIICLMLINITGCKNEKEEKEKQKIAIEGAGRSEQIKNFKFK